MPNSNWNHFFLSQHIANWMINLNMFKGRFLCLLFYVESRNEPSPLDIQDEKGDKSGDDGMNDSTNVYGKIRRLKLKPLFVEHRKCQRIKFQF